MGHGKKELETRTCDGKDIDGMNEEDNFYANMHDQPSCETG